MPLVVLDPGHGGWDRSNRGPTGYIEADGVLDIALRARDLLRAAGVTVIMTRETDTGLAPNNLGLELERRADVANRNNADAFVSIHTNAYNATTMGTETFVRVKHKPSLDLGREVHNALLNEIKSHNRGLFAMFRYDDGSSKRLYAETAPLSGAGFDYYGVLRGIQGNIPACLTEVLFHSNPNEEKLLKDPAFRKRAGEAIAKGILSYLKVAVPPQQGTPILSKPVATVYQAQEWARKKNASQWFIDLAPIFWQRAAELEKEIGLPIAVDGAYAQSAKETGFGRFGGVIPGPEWHNTCGLKTTSGGPNEDPGAHARFPDDYTGVSAHLDHLLLYAGAPGYPKPGTPDPRHFPSIKGVAPTFESLGGRWAPSKTYGSEIVDLYLTPMRATVAPEPPKEAPVDDEKLIALEGKVKDLEAHIKGLEARFNSLKSDYDNLINTLRKL